MCKYVPRLTHLSSQVGVLQSVHEGLQEEHRLRRAMLTKRAKLTLDSLLTSPRLKEQVRDTVLQRSPSVHEAR